MGPCVNSTLQNGLIVRHMPNGDIVQILEDSLQSDSPTREVDRVYMPNGVVIIHYHNQDCKVLFPTGEVAFLNKKDMSWTITNENGFRRLFKDGVYSELPRINCLSQTDPETGIITKLREDNVVFIIYTDGNRYCQHSDGTQIFSQHDGGQIRIEKENFAPVMHQRTEKEEDSEDLFETDELKSLTGFITQVFLPDACVVKTIKHYKSHSEKSRIVFKHLFQRSDYSCVIVDSDGDFRVISVNARSAINEDEERARLGQDTEYLKQMFKAPGEYTPSVYYGHISEDSTLNHIAIKCHDRPYIYKVDDNHSLIKQRVENWTKNNDYENHQELATDFEPEREIEVIGMNRNPYIKNFIYPRMFILNPEGDGVEILTQEQVDQVLKYTQHRDDYLQCSRVEYVENTQLNSMQVMNKVSTLTENQLNNQKMSKLEFPEYSEPYVIKRKSDEELEKLKPLQDIYFITNISEYTSFEPLKQNAFIEDFNRFQEWKQQQLRYETEFGIVHIPPKDGSLDLDEIEDNEFYSKRICLKILKERALMKPVFDRGQFR